MRHLILYLLLLITLPVAAAKQRNTFWYFEFGLGAKSMGYTSPHAGLSVIIFKRHQLSISNNNYWREYPNLPNDFRGGWIGDPPAEYIIFNSLTYGYAFRLNDFCRAVARGGVLTGKHTYPANFVNPKGGFLFNPPTTYDEVVDPLKGVIINPCVEFTLARFFGLSVGPSVVFTNYQNVIGIDANILLGRVRNKRLQ